MSKNRIYLMKFNNRANLSHQYYSEINNFIEMIKNKIIDEVGIKIKTRNMPALKNNWDCVNWLYRKVANDESIKDSTRETYRHHVKRLEEYLAAKGEKLTDAKQINNEFMAGYYEWLKARTQIGSANVNAEKFKTLLMKYAIKDNIMSKTEVFDLWFDKTKSKKGHDEIALTDEEVTKLWNYECESETDKIIRDMFVLNCLTGQRISDTPNVIKGYRVDNGVSSFSLTQKKTRANLDCPVLFTIADEILEKYHGMEFKMPQTQIINKRIKVIAKAAGISGECQVVEQHGSHVETKTISRDMACTTHTGRRTFITLLALRNDSWNVEKIKLYSGHECDSMVERYAKVTPALQTYFDCLPEEKKLAMKKFGNKQTSTEPTSNSSLDEAYRELKNLEEYKSLLSYIGVSPDEYEEVKTTDEACRMFYKHEDKLITSGLDLTQIKALYNAKDKSLKERREALKALVDEAAKGLK